MIWPSLVATAIIELSGRQQTSTFLPSSETDCGDLLWDIIGTQGFAYHTKILSSVRMAISILSLLAQTFTGSVLDSWGRERSRGQPTG